MAGKIPLWLTILGQFLFYFACAFIADLATRKVSQKSMGLGFGLCLMLILLVLAASIVTIYINVDSYHTVFSVGAAVVFGAFAGWGSTRKKAVSKGNPDR